MTPGPHVLVARQDSAGDVLLAGPAVRAVAAGAGRVTLLCGPRGREAAALLPGVDEVLVRHAAWIDATPEPVTRAAGEELVEALAGLAVDQALVLTSFHQSPLPLALLLRMAGVRTIAAISVDYPGSLLDVRHLVDDDLHEVERALSLAATIGYRLPDGDDGRLAVRRPSSPGVSLMGHGPYVVVHPGTSAPARAWAPDRHAALVDALAAGGRRVVVTGGEDERALTALVADRVAPHRGVTDLGGRLDLAGLAEVLAGADAVVVGNTGPAHLAAAVGTPVVSLFAPVVPAVRWRPWKVPHLLLGDQRAACAGTRAHLPGPWPPMLGRHPCRRGRRRRGAACPGQDAPGGGRVRILLWHVHGAWTTAFVHGPHQYLIPVTPGRGPDGLGRARTYTWPASAVEVTREQAAAAEVDVVVLQRPHELGWLAAEWLGGRRPGRDLPVVYLEHNAPQGRVSEMRHPAADREDLVVVHVTHFNDLFWDCGTTRTRVIEHGIVDPGYRYGGELGGAAVVLNEAVRRGRVTGTDLLARLGAHVPLDLFGMGAEQLAGTPGLRSAQDLPQDRLHTEMPRRRLYLHPVRWTSLGLSLLEAMHLGMPVVGLATTEVAEAVPPEAGVLSTRVDVLAEAARWLVADPEQARVMGKAGRAAALARYGLQRFLDDWDRLLDEVRA